MPTKSKTTRTITYKRVAGYSTATLEALLRLAVKNQCTAGQRKKDVSFAKDGENFHLLADFLTEQDFFAGVLCSYSPGRHQQVFSVEDDAEKIPLAAIKPPTIQKDGKELQQEFLEGCLYFLAKGNHLILSQSAALRVGNAESYFNWLLWEKANLHQNQTPIPLLYLKDELPPDKAAKIQYVKNLTIANDIKLPAMAKGDDTETKSFAIAPKGPIWEALLKIIPSLPKELSLAHALAAEVIQASLTLKIGRKGKDADIFIDAIATAARNQDDLDYTIDMGKYGKLKNNDFKLSTSHIFQVTNGQVNQDSIFRRMLEWLNELAEVKRIHQRV